MEERGLTWVAFLLAIVVGIAWAIGQRLVDYVIPPPKGA